MASTLAARVAQHDREIAAIRKLILAGMKMSAKHDKNSLRLEGAQFEMRQQQIAMREEMRLLAAQQRETSRTVDRFIRSMERGRNGHS